MIMTVTLNQWMKFVGLILPDRYLQIETLWDFEASQEHPDAHSIQGAALSLFVVRQAERIWRGTPPLLIVETQHDFERLANQMIHVGLGVVTDIVHMIADMETLSWKIRHDEKVLGSDGLPIVGGEP